jgi:hypothetical protein
MRHQVQILLTRRRQCSESSAKKSLHGHHEGIVENSTTSINESLDFSVIFILTANSSFMKARPTVRGQKGRLHPTLPMFAVVACRRMAERLVAKVEWGSVSL